MLACGVVCCSHQSDRRIRLCVSHHKIVALGYVFRTNQIAALEYESRTNHIIAFFLLRISWNQGVGAQRMALTRNFGFMRYMLWLWPSYKPSRLRLRIVGI